MDARFVSSKRTRNLAPDPEVAPRNVPSPVLVLSRDQNRVRNRDLGHDLNLAPNPAPSLRRNAAALAARPLGETSQLPRIGGPVNGIVTRVNIIACLNTFSGM